MKWLPPPSVPSWFSCLRVSTGCLSAIFRNLSLSSAQAVATSDGDSLQEPRSFRPPLSVRPCGTAFAISSKSLVALSPTSWLVRVVLAATIPHPMSTPTAAGMIAPTVGITLPTVDPNPLCTSGITAMCGHTMGSCEV